MLDYILSLYSETKEEYITRCKNCFNKETKEIQKELEEASTEELEQELKRHNWSSTFENYCCAIKYELMLRTDFEIEI